MRKSGLVLSALAIVSVVAAFAPASAEAAEVKMMSSEQIELKLFSKAKAISPVRRRSVNLSAVTFEFNSATLTENAQLQLDQLGKALTNPRFATNKFIVGGHTDAVGEGKYNESLSQQRADAVVNYLVVQHGLKKKMLSPVGFGERKLLPGLKPDASAHRRAEIINTGK